MFNQAQMRENMALLVDLYELTMAQCYFKERKSAWATFDLFIRPTQTGRCFYLAAGLEDIALFLKDLKFSEDSLDYLVKERSFTPEFLDYLKDFKFCGDLSALEEGTVFFANEPVIRVTAPIIEAQIIESALLNTINLQTTIASKAARVVLAAQDRPVYDFSLRRTQGPDAALKAARSSYIAGCSGTSNCLAGFLYKIPIAGTMAHSFVMSFKNELEAFRVFAENFPDGSILLVDTYDNIKGIKNAIIVAKELGKSGHQLKAIRLDSGNLTRTSILARRLLDKEGLSYVKIFASGNLDEYKIQNLIKRGARIDSFGVGTNMGVSTDAPYSDVIYKLCEVADSENKFLPTMKLSQGKVTYPGRKQVFRIRNRNGIFLKDIIGLEDEEIEGNPLLVKVFDRGRLVYDLPSVDNIRKRAKDNLESLSSRLKSISCRSSYKVGLSPGLENLHKT